MGFIEDLRHVSLESAKLLRNKSAKWNKNKDNRDVLYSGEHEFVAEVYRRLAAIDKSYPENIFVEYYRPRKNTRKYPRERPDMVYYDNRQRKTVVEIKIVVELTVREKRLYAGDKNLIKGDYEKLLEKYSGFDRKVLLVAFLGDPEYYHRDKFAAEVNKLVHGNSSIEVITC